MTAYVARCGVCTWEDEHGERGRPRITRPGSGSPTASNRSLRPLAQQARSGNRTQAVARARELGQLP
jgi:hypothetical protein